MRFTKDKYVLAKKRLIGQFLLQYGVLQRGLTYTIFMLILDYFMRKATGEPMEILFDYKFIAVKIAFLMVVAIIAAYNEYNMYLHYFARPDETNKKAKTNYILAHGVFGFGALVGVVLHGIEQLTIYHPALQLLTWILVGLVIGIRSSEKLDITDLKELMKKDKNGKLHY